MTITVTRLTARSFGTLDLFEPTPQPDPWVAEVEEFLLGPAAKSSVKHGGVMWLISEDGAPVGLATSRAHERFGAELLQGFMVDHLHRGRGLARPALEAVLASVHATTDSEFTMWLVHEDNHVMVRLSSSIDPAGGAPSDNGYFLFAHP